MISFVLNISFIYYLSIFSRVESEDPNAGAALCFYTLLRTENNAKQDSGAADVIAESSQVTTNEFVLCLLATQDTTLDLYPLYARCFGHVFFRCRL